jgi:ABC-type proline/glycine betaine transport system permease subunit
MSDHPYSVDHPVTSYMRQKFRNTIQGLNDYVPFPATWTLENLIEVDKAVAILVAAFHHRGLSCRNQPLLTNLSVIKWLSIGTWTDTVTT